ncbi:uncharacterized protein LOC126908493 [Daktulosphaira vitifoliae]|uniref:uncharacterized protein LOC126908493 n=1 Tax=Daktulosphaira vitifoliae TaxID=58002 RepID=UPI0021AAC91F|nr:uncharacterized protein LOC126908493 [Daktulosphaira vitifoliae]
MSDGRKRLSGSAYKKVAKLKLEKEQKVISQTAKLTSFFGNQRPSISNSPNEIETTAEQISNESSDKNEPNLQSPLEALANENQIIKNSEKQLINTSSITPSEHPLHCTFETMENENQLIEYSELLNTSSIIPSSDPALWSINEDLINYVCFHGFTQDLSIINFSKSKRSFLRTVKGIKKTINRSCKISYFQGTLKNGEKFRREFLAYSETKGVLFCYPCLLFSCKSSFGSTGFSLWKKADEKIQEHLNSSTHRSNILKMKLRGVTLNRIDSGRERTTLLDSNFEKS